MSKLLPYQLTCNGKPVARLYGLFNALIEFVLFSKSNFHSIIELWHGIRLVAASYDFKNWKDEREFLFF